MGGQYISMAEDKHQDQSINQLYALKKIHSGRIYSITKITEIRVYFNDIKKCMDQHKNHKISYTAWSGGSEYPINNLNKLKTDKKPDPFTGGLFP